MMKHTPTLVMKSSSLFGCKIAIVYPHIAASANTSALFFANSHFVALSFNETGICSYMAMGWNSWLLFDVFFACRFYFID